MLSAISANLWRVTWKAPIGRPNAWRSWANCRVRSKACCMAATAPRAISSRSHWKLAMISLKPSFIPPSRFSVGTNTSSMAMSAVSEASQPILSIFSATNPGWSVSTMKNEMPWWPPSAVVLTAVTMKSARTPLVMNILEPLITQPPSTSVARLLMPATSEPASGSVMPSAAMLVPAMAGRR